MRTLFFALVLAVGFMSAPVAEAARVEAHIDISQQKMRVYQNGKLKYVWPVSTARRGKVTPTGSWSAKWLSKNHRSSRYNNAHNQFSRPYGTR